MALLAGRARLVLARQGRQLLEDKRDALLRELHREVRGAVALRGELDVAAADARLALESARVRHGASAVAAAAAAGTYEVGVDIRFATVMGVRIPEIAPRALVRGPGDRGRDPLATGPALEAAAEGYEEELTIALRVAAQEARLLRLAREIRRTNSRVNALRTIRIPHLEAEIAAIEEALAQREREDRFRLKLVKRRRVRPVAAASDSPATSGP